MDTKITWIHAPESFDEKSLRAFEQRCIALTTSYENEQFPSSWDEIRVFALMPGHGFVEDFSYAELREYRRRVRKTAKKEGLLIKTWASGIMAFLPQSFHDPDLVRDSVGYSAAALTIFISANKFKKMTRLSLFCFPYENDPKAGDIWQIVALATGRDGTDPYDPPYWQ